MSDLSIPDVAGIFGLVLALLLGILELRRYRIPLQMRVREVRYLGNIGDQYFGLAFRVALVNPASQGRTVYQVEHIQVDGRLSLVQMSTYVDPDSGELYATGASGPPFRVPFALEQLMRLPLDLPPHESRNPWIVFRLGAPEPFENIRESPPKYYLTLTAKDVFGRTLARYRQEIEAKTYLLP